MFQDYLFYGADLEFKYAYRMLHLSNLVQKAQKLHGLADARAVLLGETLLGSVLLASVLQEEELVNLRVQCGDHFTAGAETTRLASTRGYAEFDEDSLVVKALDEGARPSADLLIRSLRAQSNGKVFEGRTAFSAALPFEEALNDHLERSFQMSLRVKLQCWPDREDGLLRAFAVIYMDLPGLSAPEAERLHQHIDALPSMQELYSRSSDPDALGKALTPQETRAIKSLVPEWICTCSQSSVEQMLLKLPTDEWEDILEKNEPLEIKCHYCSTKYNVGVPRIKEILAQNPSLMPEKVLN